MQNIDQSDRFVSIIEANKAIIYKVANSYCHNTEDRKDLVQEIIIQLWKSLATYDDQYKYSTWMYRIALNVAISFYRKEVSRKKISDPLTDSIIRFPDTDDTDNSLPELKLLRHLISQLPDLDKALMLLYLEEKSHKEIAQIIGISETNVATKINRIKNNFKQKFNTYKTT